MSFFFLRGMDGTSTSATSAARVQLFFGGTRSGEEGGDTCEGESRDYITPSQRSIRVCWAEGVASYIPKRITHRHPQHTMQTTDSRNLFQSSASLSKQDARQRKLVRAAKVGDPIELGSKVVRMVVRGQEAYTAESGWVARRVDLRVNSRCLFFFSRTSHESDQKGWKPMRA
jgi:hypothetical protein